MKKILEHPSVYRIFQNMLMNKPAQRKFISEYIKPFYGMKILDIGCGPGMLLDYLPKDISYTGFDGCQKYIDYAKKRFPDQTFFCEYITPKSSPLFKDSFDIVIARGILHHLDDQACKQLIECAYNHLKPGGRFITIDCMYLDKQSYLAKLIISKDRGQHIRYPKEYQKLVEQIFFQPQIIFDNLARIPYNHIIMICTKN